MNSQDKLQVQKDHYFNVGYNHKARWLTYFYQIQLLNKYNGKNILEIGPGHGWVKLIADDLGLHIETVDIDPDLKPDYVATVDQLPVDDARYDIVCAFEVLEHLPFSTFRKNLVEMGRASKGCVIISLPDHRHTLFHFRMKVPFLKYFEILIKIPTTKNHVFDGQHYWEIGKKGYQVRDVKREIESAGFRIKESLVFPDTPRNHFFVLEKSNENIQ